MQIRRAPGDLTPLEDQQLGGLIMWVPAGLVYVVAGLALFAAGYVNPKRALKFMKPHCALMPFLNQQTYENFWNNFICYRRFNSCLPLQW